MNNPLRWHLDRENLNRIGEDPHTRALWNMLQDQPEHEDEEELDA